MSRVSLAWDLVLVRVVAIKVLRRDLLTQPEATTVLRREATFAMDLTHDAIIRVYHYEPWHDLVGPFLVMEYLSWPSGEKWIADAGSNRLPVESVIDIGCRLCEAVAFVHEMGFLHGDIKPSNVFVDATGQRVKLADFGLACEMAKGSQRVLKLRLAGTPAYMAPEQRARGTAIGPRTDVYQLAATVWDFLTGEPPDRGRLYQKDIDRDRKRLLQAVSKRLAINIEDRPENAGAFGTLFRGVA
jgi:serine/threonine protein kinase